MYRNSAFLLTLFALGIFSLPASSSSPSLSTEGKDKVLYSGNQFTIYSNRVEQQGIISGEAISDYEIRSNYLRDKNTEDTQGEGMIRKDARIWERKNNLSPYATYSGPNQLERTIYNLSLDEMVNAVEADSTLRTGKLWRGVWTRDVSYSILLSMAHLQPKVSMKSLMKKVNVNGRIIQDTGTGGAWPVSSDRMIWATAAWQIYKVTGDRDWLEKCYPIIRCSVEDDIANVYDAKTGLMKGESSFLDWREQTYPVWMQSADIYESKCLGTNAVHYNALAVLHRMAGLLNKKEEAARYGKRAKELKKSINRYLWMSDKHYYAQYLYGRNYQVVSTKSETLGEALCVLFDIANSKQQQQIVSHMPVVEFGTPCIYPQIPDMFSYHNNAVWPFVQSYWMWAGAKAGNEASVLHSIAAIYRAATLFATNQENYVATTGDYKTKLNSSNMLWSLSGNLSIVYHLFFGINYEEDGLLFRPFVPKVFDGNRSLSGVNYRNMILDIEVEGYGNKITSFALDGKEQKRAFIPASLKGKHTIKITLNSKDFKNNPIHLVSNADSPRMPIAKLQSGKLSWEAIEEATSYQLLKNGNLWKTTTELSIDVPSNESGEFMVRAIDKNGEESFAGEPINMQNIQSATLYQIEDYMPASSRTSTGFTGNGFVEISKFINQTLTVPVDIKQKGTYVIDWKYANGNGPTHSKNSCAIRTLHVDGQRIGISVFPQRGNKVWDDWGFSNGVQVSLKPGKHSIVLKFLTENENMNLKTNQAMIDYLRIAPVK